MGSASFSGSCWLTWGSGVIWGTKTTETVSDKKTLSVSYDSPKSLCRIQKVSSYLPNLKGEVTYLYELLIWKTNKY